MLFEIGLWQAFWAFTHGHTFRVFGGRIFEAAIRNQKYIAKLLFDDVKVLVFRVGQGQRGFLFSCCAASAR